MTATHGSVKTRGFEAAFPAASLALVGEHAPDAYQRLKAAYEQAFAAADPALLELARLRIEQIVDPGAIAAPQSGSGLSPQKAQAVDDWSTSTIFTPAEHACLAFTEQFVFYVGAVNDALINDLLAELPADEVYGLINAIYVIDAVARLAASITRVFEQGEVR